MFREDLKIPKPAVFVNKRVLIPLCRFFLPENADFGDKFDINLYTLTGIFYLLIGLGNVFFRIRKFGSHGTQLLQKSVQTRNGTSNPRCLSFTQKTTSPAFGFLLRILRISLRSSCVC